MLFDFIYVAIRKDGESVRSLRTAKKVYVVLLSGGHIVVF